MINVSEQIKEALRNGSFFYADLVDINLGPAYGEEVGDVHLYFTTAGHDISFGGKNYKSNGVLIEAGQISRKTGAGSDNIDLVFSASDDVVVKAISARQYNNKLCSIKRVILEDGIVVSNQAIPVRSAVAVAHDIDYTSTSPTITLICDTVLGAFGESNPYWLTDGEHQKKHPGDLIMKYIPEVRQIQGGGDVVYSSDNPEGVIAPEAAKIVYGRREVELSHLARFFHYKEEKKIFNRDNRWYVTNFVLLVGHGEVEEVDLSNMKINGSRVNFKKSGEHWYSGKYTAYIRTDKNNDLDFLNDPNLSFMRWPHKGQNYNKWKDMYGKGLTVIVITHIHKQHREKGYSGWLNKSMSFTVPVKGRKVKDPRSPTAPAAYSANPALQFADFISDKQFGGGNLGISVDETSVINAANYYDNVSFLKDGQQAITKIESHQIISTGDDYSSVFDMFEKTARMVISDYTGRLKLLPEKPEPVSLSFTEGDLIDGASIEGGNLSDRVNRQIVTIKTFITDPNNANKIESVNFDCVYPQDTAEGNQIYDKWLKEDGGRPLEATDSVDFIESKEHGLYHAAVLARKARNIDTAEISPPPIAWLLEPNDVIEITDEVTDQAGRKWRVKEVNEDDGQVTLSLEDYDGAVYSPDLSALPDPDYPAEVPELDDISPITGVNVREANKADPTEAGAQAVAEWDEVTDPNLSHYRVTVWTDQGDNTNYPEVSIEKNEQTNRSNLSGLVGGIPYVINVEAVSTRGDSGELGEYRFTLGKPKAPTSIEYDASPYSITLRPDVVPSPVSREDLRFNFYSNTSNDRATAQFFGQGSQITKDGLSPSTTYHFWVATVTQNGVSETETYQAITTDQSEVINQFTGTVESNNGFYWTQTPGRDGWLPNENPIVLTAKFTDGKTSSTKTVTCTLAPTTGAITVTEGTADDITIKVTGGGTNGVSVEFTHVSGATVTAGVGAIPAGNDGIDGAGGTSGFVELDNTSSWVKAPNDGPWLPSNHTTTAQCTFTSGGSWSKSAKATLNPTAGTISAEVLTGGHSDVTVTIKNNNTNYVLVEFKHTPTGAGQSVTFVAIEGGDKGDKGSTGDRGITGKTIRAAYKSAPSQPTKPSGTTYPPSGWLSAPPVPPKGSVAWVSYTTANSPTGSVDDAWTAVGQFSGTGGSDGKDGLDGKIIRSVYKVQSTKPPQPTGATIPPSGWSINPPASIPAGSKAWVCYTYSAKTDSPTGSGYWSAVGQFSGNNGSNGPRGSLHIHHAIPGNVWNGTPEHTSQLFPNDKNVNFDTLTQYNKASKFSETRYYSSGTWIKVEQVVDGNLIVHGTIGTDALAANSITGGKIAGGTITGGNISANVSLSAPKITGGEITSGTLNVRGKAQAGSGTNVAGITGIGDWLIYAGHSTPSSAPFRVNKDGTIHATKGEFKGTVTVENLVGVLGTARDYNGMPMTVWSLTGKDTTDTVVVAHLYIVQQNFDREVTINLTIPDIQTGHSKDATLMGIRNSFKGGTSTAYSEVGTVAYISDASGTGWTIYGGAGGALDAIAYNTTNKQTAFIPLNPLTASIHIPKSTGSTVLKIPISVTLKCGRYATWIGPSSGTSRRFNARKVEMTATVTKTQDEGDFRISIQ